MKNKQLIINILSYFFIYHLVFEYLVNYYDFDKRSRILTPLGRVLRKLLMNQHVHGIYSTGDFLVFLFNLFISAILFYIAYRWFGREHILKTFSRVIIAFIIINLIIITYIVIDGFGQGPTFVYVVYFLIPMSILVVLLLPLFWINKKINDVLKKRL
ncbi:hypothetical protein [Flavobacterium sp. PL002]|uniref:hypothetical protein n=1 Tax=Flavobacterium sp. PL002 TaxID=1897058 RepID=UPI001787FF1F|nr:hypothetical protein [Flavobacterium sp. PL002]MBE0393188.1 hypothetical protein [Flavobacterium sp. PL002]